jgi:hypothetical protein
LSDVGLVHGDTVDQFSSAVCFEVVILSLNGHASPHIYLYPHQSYPIRYLQQPGHLDSVEWHIQYCGEVDDGQCALPCNWDRNILPEHEKRGAILTKDDRARNRSALVCALPELISL